MKKCIYTSRIVNVKKFKDQVNVETDSYYESAIQYQIAIQYREGVDVHKDIDIAIAFYKEAAKLNHRRAQIALSYLLLGNEGAPALDWEAYQWAKLAAYSGESTEFLHLGIMYRYGLVANINYEEALELFNKYIGLQSRSIYIGKGQYEIGLIYKYGLGVDADYTVALSWLRKAKKNGYDDAAIDIDEITDILQNRRSSDNYLNSTQKQENNEETTNSYMMLDCTLCNSI